MTFNLFSGAPQDQAMLALAAGLLEQGGPSRTPVSVGQGAARGMMQGQEALMRAQQAQQQQQLFDMKRQQLQAAQAQEAQRAAALGRLAQDPRFSGMGDLLQIAPEIALKQAFPAPRAPVVVGPGSALVDPQKPNAPLFQTPDRPPTNFREWELAKQQGFQGTYQDWVKSKAPSTTVNVGPTGIDYGKPPEGMAWARNPDGTVALKKGGDGYNQPIAVPIAGGPVELKAEETAAAKAEQQRQQKTYADVVTQDVDRAMRLVEDSDIPVTGVASFTSAIPGTPAHDLSKLLDTIKANAGFDRLQQMRAASPTGGALGQVSERENALLQATIGNLEQSQSKKQFLYNMKRVKETYLDVIHGAGNRPEPKVRRYNPKTGKIE